MSASKILPCRTASLALVFLLSPAAAAAPQHPLECVSVSPTGQSADGSSYYPSISADGRYVAFTSEASNLVPGDTNGVLDVFRKDRLTGEVVRVSVGPGGEQGDDASYTSYLTAISADGRYVCFASDARNLVPGDTNGREDIFVRDVLAGTTTRVSVGLGGVQADGDSQIASMSEDGNRIVFESRATNLIGGRTHPDNVYVRDLAAGLTLLASVSSNGEIADGDSGYPAISGDGNVVAFLSDSHNLSGGIPPNVFPSAFYLHDFTTGLTQLGLYSPGVLGGQYFAGYASLSRDGSRVAFASDAPDLDPLDQNGGPDVFVIDRRANTLERASTSMTGGPGGSLLDFPKLSADGRFVGFESDSPGLVPGDTNGLVDSFVHDLVTGATNRTNVSADGEQATQPVSPATSAIARGFSADGRYVLFTSACDGLVPADRNRKNDVFVQDRGDLTPGVYCTAKTDSEGCAPTMSFTGIPSMSSTAAFEIRAHPLPPGRLGVLLYGYGPNDEPFAGGVRCIQIPSRRAAVVLSSGIPGSGCTGSIAADFNARVRSGADPALLPGTVVYAQYRYRDHADPSGAGLGMSDALRFVVQP